MIADHVQGQAMCVVIQVNDVLVCCIWIGKVAQLNNGVWLLYGHFIHKSCYSLQAVVHDILMQVGNHAYAYRKGAGIAQDYTEAAVWYRKAAEQGSISSQFDLVFLYYKGLGVSQDYVQSYMWATIAIAGGHERASANRDIVANEMTAEQIAEAEKLAQKWLEQHQ